VDAANAAVGGGGSRELVANFNNWKKLDPRTLNVWCDVLLNSTRASLWIMNMLPYQGPEDSLRAYVESRGVDPNRVVVSEMLPASTHLTTKRCAREILRLF
jgi:predicted O-linked N-acetylglucosamine transferase (SPINDLY family)